MEENKDKQEVQDNGKVNKNYEDTMNKLVAIVRGKDNLTPGKKVKKEVVSTIVDELLKEDKEKIQNEVKTGLKDLLAKHISLNKEIAEKEKEFIKLKETKQKEFIDAANKLFGRIDDIAQLEKDYIASLNAAK